jgi:hypothetical protein
MGQARKTGEILAMAKHDKAHGRHQIEREIAQHHPRRAPPRSTAIVSVIIAGAGRA